MRCGFIAGILTAMAGGAGVAGLIVRKRHDQRQPCRRRMACLALIGGDRMIGGFGGTFTHAVVTSAAVATQVHHLRVTVIEDGDYPVGYIVAFTTIQGRGDVRGTFAGGDHTIMAALTATHSLVMIKISGQPDIDRMAGFTHIRGV